MHIFACVKGVFVFRNAVISAASVGLACALASFASAETRLGSFGPNDVLTIRLDTAVPLARLRAEIDGVTVTTPLGLSAGRVSITLPATLQGVRHDLVLFREYPDRSEELGSWTFDTPQGKAAFQASGSVELGARQGDTGSDQYLTGNGRLSYELDHGRAKAGLSFAQTKNVSSGATDLKLTDYFVERRFAIAGDDVTLRFGSQLAVNAAGLIDQTSRRGVSLRWADASARHETTLFAAQTSSATDTNNLSGLEDSADRVVGAHGYVFPFAGGSLRTSFAAYQGETLTLPSGNAGFGEGQGIGLSGPLGTGRVDFALSLNQTAWSDTDAADQTKGRAALLEFNLRASPEEQESSLFLGLELAQVDAGYFSLLDQNRLRDLQSAALTADYISNFWQISAEAKLGRTNVAQDMSAATDETRGITLDVFYTPKDFTGSFLYGTTFYAGFQTERLARIDTPAGAAAPDDNVISRFSLGFDKFQRRSSFAATYTFDQLQDMTPAAADEVTHRLELLYSFAPSDGNSVVLKTNLGHVTTLIGAYAESDLSISGQHKIANTKWSFGFDLGVTDFENPAKPDGAYAGAEVGFALNKDTKLVLSADWGNGAKVPPLVAQDGWLYGIALRKDFNIARGN